MAATMPANPNAMMLLGTIITAPSVGVSEQLQYGLMVHVVRGHEPRAASIGGAPARARGSGNGAGTGATPRDHGPAALGPNPLHLTLPGRCTAERERRAVLTNS